MTHLLNRIPAVPKALVVNDDTTQLNVLCGLLKKAGLEPVAFKSAETAMAALGLGEPPVIIVTDLYMPGLDGWRFCRLLRSPDYAQFNLTPILVVSAIFSGDEPSQITSELGANAFIAMPVEGEQFIETVQELLRGEKPQDLLKVLIVEDNKLVSKRLLKAFQSHDYQVDEAPSFLEAHTMIRRTAYDVAVLDYHLPDGLGDGLLEFLGNKSPDCICIMITADPQPELALTWLKMGAAAYLQKPFEPEYLISQCERARRERALLRIQDLLELRTQQLQYSEDKYRRLSEDTPVFISTFLPDGSLTYINKSLADLTGITPAELTGRCIFDMLTPEDRTTVEANLASLRPDQPIETHEQAYTALDGSLYFIQWTNRAFFDNLGNTVSFQAVGVDITERKRAEELQKETNQMNTDILESITDAFINLDENFVATYFNIAAERLLNKNRLDVIGRNLFEAFPEAKGSVFEEKYTQAIREKKMLSFETYFGEKPYKDWYDVRIYPQRDGISVFFQIVTERKLAEDLLKQSEERFNLAICGTGAGLWDWDILKDTVFYSTRWKSMLGYEDHEIENAFSGWKDLWHPDDAAKIEQAINDYLEGRTSRYEIEHRLRHKDGSWRWIHTRGDIQRDVAGSPVRWIGTNIDVTERKQAEELLRNLITMNPVSIQILDKEGFTLEVNPAFKLLFGSKPPTDYSIFKDPQLEQKGIGEIFDQLRNGEIVNFPDVSYNPHDSIPDLPDVPNWIRTIGFPLCFSNERPERIVLMQENITERKNAEEKLILSEQHFRSLFEQAASGVAITDAQSGRFLKINHAFCEIFGYTPEEMEGVEFKTLSHSNDIQISKAKMKLMLTGAIDKFSMEKRYIRKNGSEVWVNLSAASMWKPGDQPTSYITIVQDITPRKKTEQALHESEERYHLIDEASQDLIYSYDRQSRFTHANSSLCNLMGLKPDQIIGKTHEELGFPLEQCDEWARLHQQVYDTNSTVISETKTPLLNGDPQYFEVVLNPIHDGSGTIIGIAGTTRDINARKQADAIITEQLNELRRWHNATLGREDRIMELKYEVNRLLAETGKPPHYTSVE